MLKVGLTGGIGCGKSTVCDYFSKLGIPIIDTDVLSRQAVAKGSTTLNTLAREFGSDILLADGSLDRTKMRDLVFSDPEKLQKLESIVHPVIRKLLSQELDKLNAVYVIIAIPLLLEKNWHSAVDRILVIDCPIELQMQRTLKRDDNTEVGIQRIIDVQTSREQKIEAADDVICNDSNLDTLHNRIEQLHLYYTQLASKV